jgi:hypothetical protein
VVRANRHAGRQGQPEGGNAQLLLQNLVLQIIFTMLGIMASIKYY